jgi:hypothetical protein
MNRKNFGSVSGVVIDWCKGHGFWFDAEEREDPGVRQGGRPRPQPFARDRPRRGAPAPGGAAGEDHGAQPGLRQDLPWAEEPRRTGPLLKALVDAVGGSLLRFWKD